MMQLELQAIRKSRHLTQKQLGDAVGVSMRKVSGWERLETEISLTDAARVADVLGCTLDELAGREFPGTTALSTDERDLIGLYRDANSQGQATIMGVAQLQKSVDAASDDGPDTDHQRRTA